MGIWEEFQKKKKEENGTGGEFNITERYQAQLDFNNADELVLTNQQAAEKAKKYDEIISSGGYISQEDLVEYRNAYDVYIDTGNRLRNAFKYQGYQFTDADEAEWATQVAGLNEHYQLVYDTYSPYADETAFLRGSQWNWQWRQQQYEDNKKRIEELKAQRDNLIPQVSFNPDSNVPLPFYDQGYLSQRRELESQIAELEKQNAQYERGVGDWAPKEVDDSYSYYTSEAFPGAGTKRDYKNPSLGVLSQTTDHGDRNQWYYDENGVYRDAYGNALETDEFGNWIDPRNADHVIEDKLGLFLNASEEERNRAAAGDWGINNVSAAFREGIEGDWTYLQDWEIDVYYAYLEESKEKAYQYLANMERELDRRRSMDEQGKWYEEYEKSTGLGKVGMNLMTVPANLLGGFGGVVSDASAFLRGEDINTYSTAHSLSNYTRVVRGATSEDLSDVELLGDFFTMGDLYGAGMSILDTLAASKLPFGSVLLASSAAEGEAVRLYQEGASNEQIAFGAAAAGAAELIFESLSLENLEKIKKMPSPKTLGQFFKTILVQGGVEASEEVLTEIANTVSNAFIMGAGSDWQKLVDEKGAGALLDKTMDALHAGISGFLSGGGTSTFVAGASVINHKAQVHKQNVSVGKIVMAKTGGVNALLDLAKKLNINTAKVKPGNASQVGQLYYAVSEAVSKQTRAALISKMKEKGVSEEAAEKISDVATTFATGGKLTKPEDDLLTASIQDEKIFGAMADVLLDKESPVRQNIMQLGSLEVSQDAAVEDGELGDVEQEIAPEEVQGDFQGYIASLGIDLTEASPALSKKIAQASKDFENATYREILSQKMNGVGEAIQRVAQEKGGSYALDMVLGAALDVASDAYTEAIISAPTEMKGLFGKKKKAAPVKTESKPVRKAEPKKSEQTTEKKVDMEGKTFLESTGEEVKSISVKRIGKGGAVVTVNGGTEASLRDVSFGDERTHLAYSRVTSVDGMTAAAANKILNNPKADRFDFINEAIRAFQGGLRNESVAEKLDYDIISADEARALFEEGRKAAAAQAQAAQKLLDEIYQKAKAEVEKTGKKVNAQLRYADGLGDVVLEGEQAACAELAAQMVPALRGDIVLYDGPEGGKMGYYKYGEDAIYLNVNAKFDEKSMMAFVLAHEMVHRGRHGSPLKYQAFADLLIQEFTKKGVSLDVLIQEQLTAAKEAKVKMTRTQAFEEVICDACQRMLTDTKAGRILAEWGAQNEENRGFLENLKEFLTKLFNTLRKVFAGERSENRAVAAFRALDKSVQNMLAEMYVDMTKDAAEKLNVIKAADLDITREFLASKDISYNLAAAESHKAQLSEEYSENATVPLDTLMQRYDKILRIWKAVGIKLDSKFLNEWNSKVGTDQAFSVFKAQSGYKYNIELSTMCKKGVALFEAIDTIVRNEIMKEIGTKVLGKAEKEILYDILKSKGFEIPCAICYVEQARQREGVIIDAFLNGNNSGKLGWNSVLDSIEAEMAALGMDFAFPQVSREIATEKYTPANLDMDQTTQDVFFGALMTVANKEIERYNKEAKKNRPLIKAATRSGIQDALKGNVPANLKIFKVLAEHPSARFRIEGDLLYSSMTTRNLAGAHQQLYSLFNAQGGVSGYKTKQTPVVYWGDLLGKKWRPSDLRKGGGIRNQSNSDHQMYTLLDQVQMYIDLTAKGYYLQAYTKVVSELKLLGLSRAKMNASLIPKVVVYYNNDGAVDVARTKENAGLDENGNPIFDDFEGINSAEAFMLIADPEYSKSIGGVCIGYSDKHIWKLLDDARVQLIIGFHDKTNDPNKRYRGARYAKNYNGLNEAKKRKADGKYETVHVGFNSFVQKAEKMFRFDSETETYSGTVTRNGKTYTADDIPRLAADLYLEKYDTRDENGVRTSIPAYDDFKEHPNYYKLLADFSLYDSQGHYAPHRKVAYNMPATVPYLDANGNKQTMPTQDYIQAELEKEMATRDELALQLADESDQGIIPQFRRALKDIAVPTKVEAPEGEVSWKSGAKNKKPSHSAASPLTRRPGNQGSVGSTHVNMSSTAAAELLGIGNINDLSDSVKKNISALAELYRSVLEHVPVLGFRKPTSASSLEGELVALGILSREGSGGSAYRYDNGHALRISNHSANADNFVGQGEHLSVALFESGSINDFVEGAPNVIEAVFRVRYLDSKPEALGAVIHDIAHFIAEGEYHDTAGALRYNYSGTNAFKAQAAARMEQDRVAREEATVNKLPVGTSSRVALVDALEGLARRDEEKRLLNTYRTYIKNAQADQERLVKTRKEIARLRKEGDPNKRIPKLQQAVKTIQARLDRNDSALLELEGMEILKGIMERAVREQRQMGEAQRRQMSEQYRADRADAVALQKATDADLHAMEQEFLRLMREYEKQGAKRSQLEGALAGKTADYQVMEKEFLRLMRAYEKESAKRVGLEADVAELGEDLESKKQENRDLRENQKLWEAEFRRLMTAYDRADRKVDRLEEQIQQMRDSRRRASERRKASEVRGKIKRLKARMQSTLLNPTEKNFVPVSLFEAIVSVLELVDDNTELYKPDGTINQAQAARDATYRRLNKLKDLYGKLDKTNGGQYKGEFDEYVAAYLDELFKEYEGRSLAEMSLDELGKMYEILKSIQDVIMDARKLIGMNERYDVYEATDAIAAEQQAITDGRKNGKRNFVGIANDTMNNQALSPMRNIERMAGYDEDSMLVKLFREIEKGVRKANLFMMRAYKMFEELTASPEYDDALYKEVTVDGKTVEYTDYKGRKFGLSKMQMMQAILSYEREQAVDNLNHIATGGFTFADLRMLRKGKLKEAISEENSHRVPAATEMVLEFIEILKDDKWCQDYMAVAREFFNHMAKDAINEASIATKHRAVATGEAYVPFETDQNFVVKEIGAAADEVQQTISSYGMLKDTQNNAPQPLIVTGLNNLIERHISQVGNVYGLAVPIRNFNKVWTTKTQPGVNGAPTVRGIIEGNWGTKGAEHIEQAVRDVQGPRANKQGFLGDLYKKLKSNYIGATFLFNLSVVMKQLGSLFTATSMIQWRNPVSMMANLIYTATHFQEIAAEVDQYTASVWMRRQGLSDAELSTLMTEGQKTWLGKLAKKGPAWANPTKWIAGMDSAVALSLWRYCKEDVAARTGLEGEALLEATAEFFDDVVENTQSMTDVLHRPEIQKNTNIFSEPFAMFKTDVYQMAGQLNVAAGRAFANPTKENKRALGKTVYSIAMSAVWGQLMTAAFAALRYKMDRYKDDDDELTWKSFLKRSLFSLGGDLAGYVFPIFGSEIVGIGEALVYGETDDFLDNMTMSNVNELYSMIISISNAMIRGKEVSPQKWNKLIAKALQLFGVPTNNIIRLWEAIRKHAQDIAEGEFFAFNEE